MDQRRLSKPPAGGSAEPGDERRWRLTGRVEEQERSFLLTPGDNPVGSGAGNAVVLAVRGVSRRHALVHAAGGGVVVEDLGSKNGTSVNGRRVGRSPVGAGDEVAFGPVRLRLEEVAAEDAEVGFEVSAEREPSGVLANGAATTSRLVAGRDSLLFTWLRLVEDAVERLTTAPADPAGALAAVAGRLELAGAALVAWPADGEPVVEAVAGRLGAVPSTAEARRAAASGRPLVTAQGPPIARTWWALAGGDGGVFGLVLWGDFHERRESEPLLAALVRLFRRFRGEPLADLPAVGAPAAAGGLVFPAGYVPGESPAMRALYRQMEPLLGSDLPVLIAGETGVGKEPLARALHASSPRRRGPFVAVNCAAIPAELLEAEMFGIGRNVATGVAERTGKLVEATGGTILLDEIGDMPPALQAKLLRALQEREVQPVGRPPVAVDVRLVAATNVDLRRRAASGGFRRDLFYRIAGFVLEVPPLRRRGDDLPQLLGHFLRLAGREAGKPVRGLTVKALRHLAAYPWPGNVRELEHEVRRLVYLCPYDGVVDSTMLPEHIVAPDQELGDDADDEGDSLDLAARTEALERRLLRRALARARGNQTRAAKLLGISRNGLANRLKRLGIDPEEEAGP